MRGSYQQGKEAFFQVVLLLAKGVSLHQSTIKLSSSHLLVFFSLYLFICWALLGLGNIYSLSHVSGFITLFKIDVQTFGQPCPNHLPAPHIKDLWASCPAVAPADSLGQFRPLPAQLHSPTLIHESRSGQGIRLGFARWCCHPPPPSQTRPLSSPPRLFPILPPAAMFHPSWLLHCFTCSDGYPSTVSQCLTAYSDGHAVHSVSDKYKTVYGSKTWVMPA